MGDGALPELKQIVGAMLFVRKEPLGVADILKALRGTAERMGGATKDFAAADEERVGEALAELGRDLEAGRMGFHLAEVAGGWRLENDASCGPWLRVLLQKGRGTKLSPAALETLAIVAYRQPCARSEIEGVRGVAVDAILKNLLELQLVRVTGRSDLPGRPWLFGTTRKFLEHFGLKSLDELPDAGELRRQGARRGAAGRRTAAEDASGAAEDPRQMKMSVIEEAVPAVESAAERAAAALAGEDGGGVVERDETGDAGAAAARRARAAALVVDAPEQAPENPNQLTIPLIEESAPRVETEEERAAAELGGE